MCGQRTGKYGEGKKKAKYVQEQADCICFFFLFFFKLKKNAQRCSGFGEWGWSTGMAKEVDPEDI